MSTLPDASHGVDALSRAPPQQAQGKVYPSMYPLPGSSHPPLSSPPNVTFPAFTSFVPGVYNAGGVNYFPNYQGLSTTYLPTGFIPPTQNSAPPTNVVNFQAPCYPFYDMPVGTATSTTTLLSSEDTGRHEQSAQFTFQCPLPAQPDAAPAQQQWQGQHHQQVAQEDSTVEKPPLGAQEIDTEGYQTREESHEALAELENTMVHCCSDNPKTACSGHGKICFDVLCAFVRDYPHALSPEQVAYLIATIAGPESNGGQSIAGQHLQVDTNDPLPYQHGAASWETASSGSSTTASTSTSEHSSPSGSFLCPPNQLEASSSVGTSSSSTGKRQRPEDYPEDRPKKQRQEGCTDRQGNLEEHCQPCNNRILDGREKRRKKKKKNSDGREFVCVFCAILGAPHRPFSRKDSLKRHVRQVHEIFQILFGVDYREFKVLEPRRVQDYEDLRPLVAFCIILQSQARQQGVEIREEHDLSRLYPYIAAAVNHS